MTAEQIKQTYLARVLLDTDDRLFICNDEIKSGYKKQFHLVNQDVRLLQFANDRFGMTSDCFILYAIASLGCPTKEAIVYFLETLAKKEPSLNVVVEKDSIADRIRYLRELGLLMRFTYSVVVGKDKKKKAVTMFVITEDGVSIVRQHLRRRCQFNAGFYAKHINDLIGWSSAAYAGSLSARVNRGFVEFCDGLLRTKQMGAMFFSTEWKAQVDEVMYYVAFMPSFIEYDNTFMTRDDYEGCCAEAVNKIRNYLNCRTQKGVPCVVVVVRDNKDLNNIALNIYASGVLNSMLDNIYFTGEGALRGNLNHVENAYFQMKLDSNEPEGYVLYKTNAPFIA